MDRASCNFTKVKDFTHLCGEQVEQEDRVIKEHVCELEKITLFVFGKGDQLSRVIDLLKEVWISLFRFNHVREESAKVESKEQSFLNLMRVVSFRLLLHLNEDSQETRNQESLKDFTGMQKSRRTISISSIHCLVKTCHHRKDLYCLHSEVWIAAP